MKIETKYEIGNKIKYVVENQEVRYSVCPCCNGNKVIEGYDRNYYPCPLCDELGEVPKETYTTRIEKEGIICSIHIHYDSNNFDGLKIYYNVPRSHRSIYEESILGKE